ncbi:MAG: pyridoxamine 5'-phosphate oxidase family protein [Pseudomonadota bacterium]
MEEILAILAKNPIIYLATAQGDQPRVRPFQFQLERDGKLWFVTANNKEVYAQLRQNPKVQFSTCLEDMTTLRVSGTVTMDDSMEIKQWVMDNRPMIKGIYGSADNPVFAAFCLEHGQAVVFDFSGNPPRQYTF